MVFFSVSRTRRRSFLLSQGACFTFIVSFWDYTEYSIIPDFIWTNYHYIFSGCFEPSRGSLFNISLTYASTLFYCIFCVAILTLIIGFTVAFFLAFHVRSLTELQIGLFLICTIPFWTSNVIRMVSVWIPLLGRNGLFNEFLLNLGLMQSPIEWFLYSPLAVLLAFVHLYTLFMIVPIFNSMIRIDHSIIEAAYHSGANGHHGANLGITY